MDLNFKISLQPQNVDKRISLPRIGSSYGCTGQSICLFEKRDGHLDLLRQLCHFCFVTDNEQNVLYSIIKKRDVLNCPPLIVVVWKGCVTLHSQVILLSNLHPTKGCFYWMKFAYRYSYSLTLKFFCTVVHVGCHFAKGRQCSITHVEYTIT